jgi:hypothetical protein
MPKRGGKKKRPTISTKPKPTPGSIGGTETTTKAGIPRPDPTPLGKGKRSLDDTDIPAPHPTDDPPKRRSVIEGEPTEKPGRVPLTLRRRGPRPLSGIFPTDMDTGPTRSGQAEGTGDDLMDVDKIKPALGADALANAAFADLLSRNRMHNLTTDNYLDELAKSVADDVEPRPISFVVNIILPYKNVGDIPNVVKGIMTDADGMAGKVAFVFGINAKEGEEDELDQAWRKAARDVAASDLPIAVVKDTWKGKKFPYGTIRNGVLNSTATKQVTGALWGAGTHPYISIQDFDAGRRTVPSGAHVFNHFADKLAGKDPRLDPDEQFPIRPLMMAGGYRPGRATKLPTKPRTMEVDEFATHITEDMLTREELSKTHPLLPYSPEPNLYIDGTALLVKGSPIAFGKGQAEFTELSRGLNARYAEELSRIASSKPLPDDVPMVEASPPPKEIVGMERLQRVLPETRDGTELRSEIQGMAENLRHPIRGIPFVTDFIHGATETELSRLAEKLGKVKKKDDPYSKFKLPQTHVQTKNGAERIFAVKDAIKGTSTVVYGRKRRETADPDPMGIKVPSAPKPEKEPPIPTGRAKPLNAYGMRESASTEQIWTPGVELAPLVGGTEWDGGEKGKKKAKYDRVGPIVSRELSSRGYTRIYAGLKSSETSLAMHNVSFSTPTRNALHGLDLLKRDVLSTDYLTGERTMTNRVPIADGSLFDAVAKSTALAEAVTREQLRDQVIDTAIGLLEAEEPKSALRDQPVTRYLVDKRVKIGDLAVALAQNRNWITPKPPLPVETPSKDERYVPDFLPGDTERAQNVHLLAMKLLASNLGRPIALYKPTATKPFETIEPFGGTKEGADPVPIIEHLTSDDTMGRDTRRFAPYPT